MLAERHSESSDCSAHGHEPIKGFGMEVVDGSTQEILVETVRGELLPFDRQEVSIEKPIQHHGQETRSVQFAKAGLPNEGFVETVGEIQGAIVQSCNPVLADQAMKGDRLQFGRVTAKSEDVEVKEAWIAD
jgi:hypothetical protein